MMNDTFQTELTDEELQQVNGGNGPGSFGTNGTGSVFGPDSVTSTVGGTSGTTVANANGVSSSIFGVVGTGNGPGAVGGYVQSAGVTSPYLATEAQGAVGGLSYVPFPHYPSGW